MAARLRCAQIDVNFARGEAERAQALAEQHRAAAESLERQIGVMQKNLEELRKAKEVRSAQIPPPSATRSLPPIPARPPRPIVTAVCGQLQ